MSSKDSFGGAYITHNGDITLNVLVKLGHQERQSEVVGRLPSDASVTFVDAQYSLADLHTIRETIVSSAPSYAALGSTLVGVGHATAANQIVAAFDGPIDDIARDLTAKYGTAVRASRGTFMTPLTCPSRSSCTPWRGGIKVRPVDDTGLECTYGFNARFKTGSTRYMITAGHCDANEQESWEHNGALIGTTGLNNLLSCCPYLGDFQRVPRTNLETPMNLVYHTHAIDDYQISGVRTYNNQIEGDSVNLTGKTSGTKTGTIVNWDYKTFITFRGNTVWYWSKLVDVQMAEGDSGGPTYWTGKANGFISAVNFATGETSYSTAADAQDALNVWICTTPSC